MITPLELETERLLLRPMCIGDAEAVFAYRSDAVTNRYQGWIPRTLGDMHDFGGLFPFKLITFIEAPTAE